MEKIDKLFVLHKECDYLLEPAEVCLTFTDVLTNVLFNQFTDLVLAIKFSFFHLILLGSMFGRTLREGLCL